MSSRVYEGDLFYCGWWVMLLGMVIFLLFRIEMNTRNGNHDSSGIQ